MPDPWAVVSTKPAQDEWAVVSTRPAPKEENKPLGWRDEILRFWRPLSPEEQKGITQRLGNIAGPVAIGFSNTAMGTAEGAANLLLHPLGSIWGTAQTAADALNQLFPDSILNPKQKAAKQASLDRLKDQWEQIKTNPDYAMGNLAGAILGADVASEAVGPVTRGLKETAGKARESARGALRNAAGISTEDIGEAAKRGTEESQKHAENTQEAVNEQQRREDLERNQLRNKTEEIEKGRTEELEKQKREHAKAVSDYEKEKANADKRKQLEDELTRKTSEHYALEDQREIEAREKANEPWNRWHGRMDKVPVEQDEVYGELKKSGALTPQVEEQLKFIEPDARAEAPTSKYALTRSSIMENLGETKPYEDLPTYKQQMYDRITQESGVHPEPIDLSPDAPATTVGKLQQARSVLEERIRAAGGRGEHFDVGGVSVGRMKVVSRVLGDIINKYSKENGAFDDLEEGRVATRQFKEAFGRAAPKIRTQVGIREAWLNPEGDAARTIEDNLEKSAKIDPKLAESAKQIRALRDELKKLPKKGYPEPSKAFVPRLTAESAESEARPLVAQPDRPEYPNKPEQIDLLQNRAQEVMEKGSSLKHSKTANFISHALTGFGSTWALVEVLRGELSYGAAVVGSRILIGAAQRGLGSLLENPAAAEWIARPSASDIEAFSKLTPQQKAVFATRLEPLLNQAKAQGIKVSPALAALVGSGAAIGPKTQSLQNTANDYRTASQ